jgi:hypothetical protein
LHVTVYVAVESPSRLGASILHVDSEIAMVIRSIYEEPLRSGAAMNLVQQDRVHPETLPVRQCFPDMTSRPLLPAQRQSIQEGR